MKIGNLPLFAAAMTMIVSCSPTPGAGGSTNSEADEPAISSAPRAGGIEVQQDVFAQVADPEGGSRDIKRWTLRNASGSGVTVMELGATILSLEVADREGNMDDVVLGFDSYNPYLTQSPYFGAVVGRYANRIAKGRFKIDGKAYQLPINNPPNSLHGGDVGYDKRIWRSEQIDTSDGPGVRFSLTDEDGEQGYPGQVDVTVTYVWTIENELIVDYYAKASEPTPFNIAQHSYWNLSGARGARSILDHELRIDADAYTPVDKTLIPTGAIVSVDGTPFDFRQKKSIGRDIGVEHVQLSFGGGYDHNWVLNGAGMREAAWLHDPSSGRTMTIMTDQPGIQFYSGNFLDGTVTGKFANAYPYRSGLALETQHFPDSPNQESFPSTLLVPERPFSSRTTFAFGIEGSR